jgi:amino acid transporter
VNAKTKTPIAAIAAATIAPLLLVLGTAPLSDALFDAMAKMSTMGLYVSYAAPIALGLRARLTGRWTKLGPFHLRSMGVVVAAIAVAWSAFVLTVCSLPPNQLPAKMLLGCIVALAVVWLTLVRKRFTGPKVTLDALES